MRGVEDGVYERGVGGGCMRGAGRGVYERGGIGRNPAYIISEG
jgi:hypothetical protein